MKKSFILFLLFTAVFISACCNCGKSDEERTVKGVITVVGNEPFAKLAIRLDNDDAFVLQCTKELEKELMGKQGSHYSILYYESKTVEGVPVLVVAKALPLNQENK